jgi:hypothetical protein
MRGATATQLLLICVLAFGAQGAMPRESRPVRRTILAVYDSAQYRDVRDTRIHRLLEMPLNHLGMVVRYHDLRTGLPPMGELEDVRGIVTWFRGDSMPHPIEFLQWGEAAIDSGRRFVVIGGLSASKDDQGQVTPVAAINRFFAKIGIRIENWTPVTYNQRIVYRDSELMGFERPLPTVLPPFDRMRIIDPQVRSHLTVRRDNGDPATESALIVTGPHGGWVEVGYSHFANDSQDRLQWYINPFEFLRLAFASDEVPKPDTTTLSGRRLYYSQVDGDGWRNITEVARYRREKLSSAEVILKEAILPFPDLPITVGPIVGDLDEDWFGTRESLSVAREMLALPWVEAGSHTYSHPLDWETLYQRTADPEPVHEATSLATVSAWFDPAHWTTINRAVERYSRPEADEGKATLRRGHALLRSYSLYPFDPDQEIRGSIAFLNRLLPAGKQVAIMQWSGTTLVPEAVLRATQQAGVRNINGGDTRFDREFNSYAWVSPLTRQAGKLRQIYSSDSNENIYTNSWNERYFGFRYLRETLDRTESPLRVKPVNIYYHMYSGEKQPGIDAVVENLQYARSQELAPIAASQYAAIVDGFHSAELFEVGPRAWRIENRDGLDSIRFDHADADSVDWSNSKGVIGQRHYQGSLYLALDSADRSPVVALASSQAASVARPWLIQSRWMVSKLSVGDGDFRFEARGFGAGEMEWHAAPGATYEVRIFQASRPTGILRATASHEGRLLFTMHQSAIDPVEVRVTRVWSNR